MPALLSSRGTTGTPFRAWGSRWANQRWRSLVTTPRAAVKFEQSHLSSPAVAPLIDAAKIFYVEGYFLPYGIDSALELGKKASEKGKVK